MSDDLRQRARDWITGFLAASDEDRVNCVALLLCAAEDAYRCAAESHKARLADCDDEQGRQEAPERDHPWLRCPDCSDGRLVAYEKSIDVSKPAWRRFDCGHYVDDRARLYALRLQPSSLPPRIE